MKAPISDQVKLLVTFPSDVDLNAIIQTLRQTYLFIQHIKKSGPHQLLISFDSMSDLLQIDFIEQCGAITTRVRNSNSFCIEMKEGHYSSDDLDSSTNFESLTNNKEKFENENTNKYKRGKAERLTSLEDEVDEQQEVIRNLALFGQEEDVWKMEEGGQIKEVQEENLNLGEEEKKEEAKESIWGPLVNGVVLTSLLVGGVKAFRFFFR